MHFTVAFDGYFSAALQTLIGEPSTTPLELPEHLDTPLEDVMIFWAFGFEQGLLINPVK